ncbi:hypothetical protein OA92_02960 [Marinomonas sp. SBI22]|uniref:YdgA family protein n=1 Tax=unclassified Marinomonas TaxID=196814 RepID=UPI0007AFC78E|nr:MULTISPECIES: DUF945 family protein [unclassified Marinomonas]KZM38897.1 hypothetical protein OA91_23200 [Marinomonas sp. SBI8L]KZM44847.1 hypothetical protein OA92_02960 [Marinomonas sp. SBI22]
MNKAIPITASVVILGALITPKVVGTKVEEQLNESIAAINEIPGYKLEILEQNMGWFSSQSKLSISYDISATSPDYQGELLITDLDLTTSHGPILTDDGFALGLLNWQVKVAADELREGVVWPEDKPFYQIKGQNDFLLNGVYQDEIVAFTSHEDSTTKFSFSGYQGQGSYKDELFNYQGNAKSFNASSDIGVFDSNDLSVDMEMEGSFEDVFSSGFYNSEFKMALAKTAFRHNYKNEVLDIDNAYITSKTLIDEASRALDVEMVYGIDTIKTNDFEGSELELGLSLKHLSEDFFLKYQDMMKHTASFNADTTPIEMMEILNESLLPLLIAEPEFNITHLKGIIPEGSFNSHLNASLKGITALPNDLNDPQFWLSHSLVDGQIYGDKAVVELAAKMFMLSQLASNPQTQGMSQAQLEQLAESQVPMLLQTINMQGLIVLDNEGYSASLSLKDNVFKVNNNQVPLPF